MSVVAIAGWALAGMAASVAHGVPAPDTAVELRRGDRVVVERLAGDLHVQGWSRSTLTVDGDGDELRGVEVTRSGSVVTLRPDPRREWSHEVDAVMRVPMWAPLEVSGRDLEVRVVGVEGGVTIRNVSGDIRLESVVGEVSLATVEGEIEVYGARGPVGAHSRGDDVTLVDVEGDVDVGTGDGDVRLENVNASKLRAETLDGDVYFSGTLAARGTYAISVHDGDATLVLSRDTNANVSVATFDGELSTEFPVTLHRYKGGGVFDFKLGDGSAQLDVKVFDGEILFKRR